MYFKASFKNKFKANIFFSILLIAITLIILNSLFKDILHHPNNFLFGAEGDGIKNYYTFIYYALYNSGSHFTGMNYPYGDNVIFTDSQPLLSYLTNLFHHHVFPVSENIIGIINLSLIFSTLIGAYFLYLILRKNLLPEWYSAITAILIVFLSPQHTRLAAHYALSYVFILPLIWYLIIRLFESPKKYLWFALYIIVSLLSGFIHPYFLTIGNVMLLAHTFIFLIQERKLLKENIWFIIKLIFSAIIPIILFQSWLTLTYNVIDRPEAPYGFLIYRTTFESVFFPVETPFRELWMELFKTEEPIWEGYSYVGLLGLTCLFLTFLLSIRYLFRLQIGKIIRPVLPKPLKTGIWAATVTLLFAMGIPFIWNLENWLDIIPPLKQFRSIGRFAWIFYYIFSVYSAFYFYRLYRYLSLRRASKFGFSFLCIIFIIWIFDVKGHIVPKVKEIRKNEKAFHFLSPAGNYNEILLENQKYSTDYQAIIPLPFYHVGSEHFALYKSHKSVYESMRASINLQLPIVSNMMSRSSVSQSAKVVQLLSTQLITKEILTDLPSQKPFLIIESKEPLSMPEQTLRNKGRKLYENNEVILYELPVSALQTSMANKTAVTFEKNKDTFAFNGNIFTTYPNTPVVIKSFNSAKLKNGLFDSGAAYAEKGTLVLFDGIIPKVTDTVELEVSVWKNINKAGSAGVLVYRQYNESGTKIEEKIALLKETTEIYKNWQRPSLNFKLINRKNRIEITIEGDRSIIDNLMIKPINSDVYYYTKDNLNLIYNNYLIKSN